MKEKYIAIVDRWVGYYAPFPKTADRLQRDKMVDDLHALRYQVAREVFQEMLDNGWVFMPDAQQIRRIVDRLTQQEEE